MQSDRQKVALVFGLVCGAVACAAQVDDKDREQAKIQYHIGIAQMNKGDMRGALRDLLSAVELDATQPEAHNALGLVYHALQRQEEALEHYRTAVRLRPGFSEAHNNLGILLLDLGRFDEAIAAFKVALADILYATPSLAEGNMGWAYFSKGEVETGLRHLRNAVASNPKFCRGYEWLARVALHMERPEDAVASVKRFEKHCVSDEVIAASIPKEYRSQMGYYLALAYLKSGDRDAARDAFAQCADSESEGFGKRCATSLDGLQ